MKAGFIGFKTGFVKKGFYYLAFAFLLAGGFLFFEKALKAPPRPILKVSAYSSFAGAYGPGRIIKKRFESFCGCRLIWLLAEDSTALSQRLALIPETDMIIGWDQITKKSGGSEKWEDLSFLKAKIKKIPFAAPENLYFAPLDWSPIGFIYKEGQGLPPKSLKSLYEAQGKISFPEPRSSSLGLQLYYWIYEAFGGDKGKISDFLKKLKGKIYGPVFSWSLAYGFFRKGQSAMGLSYLSSLLYHQEEKDCLACAFAFFEEGQAYQIEFFSIPKKSKQKNLAFLLAEFLLSKEAGRLILKKHYMFPALKDFPKSRLLAEREIKLISYGRLDDFISRKKELLKLWEDILY